MNQDKKKIYLAIIIGIVVLLILLALVLHQCSKEDIPADNGKDTVSVEGEDVTEEEEYDVPENPSIGSTETGEEVEEEAGAIVAGPDKNMDEDAQGAISADKLEDTGSGSGSSGNTGSGSGNTKPGTEDKPSEEKQPDEEEESGGTGEDTNKFGTLY